MISSKKSSISINNDGKDKLRDILETYADERAIIDRKIFYIDNGKKKEIDFFDIIIDSFFLSAGNNRTPRKFTNNLDEEEKKFSNKFRSYMKGKMKDDHNFSIAINQTIKDEKEEMKEETINTIDNYQQDSELEVQINNVDLLRSILSSSLAPPSLSPGASSVIEKINSKKNVPFEICKNRVTNKHVEATYLAEPKMREKLYILGDLDKEEQFDGKMKKAIEDELDEFRKDMDLFYQEIKEKNERIIRNTKKRLELICSGQLDRFISDYGILFLREINFSSKITNEKLEIESNTSKSSQSTIKSFEKINSSHKEKLYDLIGDYATKKNIEDRNILYEKDGKKIEISLFDAIIDPIINGGRMDKFLSLKLSLEEKRFRDYFRNYARGKNFSSNE